MYHWSTHRLTEYFAAVSQPQDGGSAIAIAVELAVEALEAEVGAVVVDDEVQGCWGFSQVAPVDGLLGVAGGADTLVVPAIGDLHAVSVGLGRNSRGTLIVARVDEAFRPEERQMLRGMAQVLGLALHSIHVLSAERTLREDREREAAERLTLLDSLQTRQRLMETLLAIQRAISHRKPLQDILDAVTAGAAGLLDGAVVALVLAEPGPDKHLAVASTCGQGVAADPELMLAWAAEAMAADAVLIRPLDPGRPEREGVIAAPVNVGGEMAGSLVARLPGDMAGHAEQRDQLAAFAQQVSLALADARTVAAVREAYHDSLTGLPNRTLFLDMLKRALASGGAVGVPTSVLFVDLDRFKAVNDSLGHKAGDDLLGLVAARIRGCLRDGDTGARLGGDEFAVLLHGASTAPAVTVARRVIGAVKEPFRIAGRDVFVGASIGIATSRDADVDSGELLSNADVAMYRAKKDGPGKVVVFEPRMHTEVLEHLNLHGDLQRALHQEEFRLQYQPLVRLATGEPVGVEALLRWSNPVRGNVPPSDFIPIAEDTGLITDIGRWVLATSAAQVAQWRQTFPGLTLNVNVSGRQLLDPQFASDVARTLVTTRLPADAVTLELTESVLMSDPDTAMACLANLRRLGVGIAIDDFGTGYSSLSYLRQLPVNELKIDRAFVSRADLTVEDLAVLRTVIELGRTLRLRTVAEGIEDEAQLQALRRLGCEFGQGYHLCRPTVPADVPAFFRRTSVMSRAA
jgi:diguanylate cyclase (GGDEF)-like protein